MKVRMIAPDGKVSIITKAEAIQIKNNVFLRPGNVSIESIPNGYKIKDSNGVTLLTAILEGE